MATAAFVIRCKTENGNFTLSHLNGSSSVKKLKEAIRDATKIDPVEMKILHGYPPKPVMYENDNAILDDVNIRSGDTLIISVGKAENEEVSGNKEMPVLKPEESMPVINFNYEDVLSDYNGIMLRHEVPANNSCLFTSIYFILQGEMDLLKSNELRYVIAKAVRKDPAKFNEAFLGRSNREYSDWILNPDHWGGAIELSILSEFYHLEICAIDIISCKMHRFGENNFYQRRAVLIYDGIHYDPLVMHLENERRTVFPITDERVLDMAMEIAKEAQSSRQFTDLVNFKVKCNVCGHLMRGDKEATAHAVSTGHCQFGEL